MAEKKLSLAGRTRYAWKSSSDIRDHKKST
jgi:hypothetical protein